MGLTTAGMPTIANALFSTLTDTNTSIGVGDSGVAEAIDQTDLQGANKFIKQVDSGSISVQDNVLHFTCTYGPDEANFAWLEFGVFVNGVMIARKPRNNGTKMEGQTWVIQVSLSLLAAE